MKVFQKVFLFSALATAACHKGVIDNKDLRDFEQVNLVANKEKYNPKLVDTTLQNAWGLAWAPNGVAWVNSNHGSVSELYMVDGTMVRPGVKIPSPTDSTGGAPSGIVFSGGAGFTLPNKQASLFLFAGEDGILSGWNPTANNNALKVNDRSATSSYKGLALASNNGANFIYAANFKTGKVDVWDTTFAPVSMPFHDPAIPSGFAPFNIQPVGNWLFVAFAKQGDDGDETDGPGLGFVDVFNTDGSFVRRFASGGTLNSPWGIAITPAGFLKQKDLSEGKSTGSTTTGLSKDDASAAVILIGNQGDGRINVFAENGQYLGQLQSHNQPIVIDKLWALGFAPAAATSVDPLRLYFTAGPDDENDGLFGYLFKQ